MRLQQLRGNDSNEFATAPEIAMDFHWGDPTTMNTSSSWVAAWAYFLTRAHLRTQRAVI